MNRNTLERIFRKWPDWNRRFSTIMQTGERFSWFCKQIIEQDKTFEDVHLHTGLWIPKDGNIPKRLPVILVPALEIMKGLLEAWIQPPRLVIYQATTAISAINNINPELSFCISNYMESKLRTFILMNFPELRPYISFYFWERKNDMTIAQDIGRYVDEHIELLRERKDNANFISSWKKHGNWAVNHFFYVVANSYYNGGYKEYPFTEIWNPHTIIPIWGRSETDFFKVLLETQQSCREIFPLITQVWAFPTYYTHPHWDILDTEDDCWWNQLHPDIKKDISVLSHYTNF